MSNSLLKRSLQIVEESLDDSKSTIATQSKKKSSKQQRKTSSAFDLIPENQRLIKISKDRKTQVKSKRPLYIFQCCYVSSQQYINWVKNIFVLTAKINELKQKQKITIKQAKNTIIRKKDKISENVRKLLLMQSAPKLSDEATETLLRRARTQRYVIPEKKPVEESTTAFTEEDFLKFEKEYFVN